MDAFMTLPQKDPQYRMDRESHDFCIRHGEKIDVENYTFCMGGNATNVAVGLSRLGIKATLCSEIGDDEFSIKIRNALAKEYIDRLFVIENKDKPSNFAVVINYRGDRTIFVQDIDREHKYDLSDASAEYVYLTSMGREWQKPYKDAVKFAQKHGAKIVFNPGSRQQREGRATVDHVLRYTEILIVNKEEAGRLVFSENYKNDSNEHDYIKDLAEKLNKSGPKIVVITNGDRGSFCLDPDGKFHYRPMHPGEPVERTGAGDSYSSGFLAGLIHGASITDAMHWGSINAAAVVAKIGAQAGLLTKIELEAKME